MMATLDSSLDFRTAPAAHLLPFQLTTHTLDLDVKIAFPTGGVLASPHSLLLPLHRDLSPFHLLSEEGPFWKSVICISQFISKAL